MTALWVLALTLQAPVSSLAVLRAGRGLELEAPPPSENGTASRRVAWFHPPKTATSFGSTLAHYANPRLPPHQPGKDLEKWPRFLQKYKGQLNGTFWLPASDHERVTDEAYEEFKGAWAGLFRLPEQRIISSFQHKGQQTGDVRVYAERTAGTVVKELAGQEHGEYFACWPGYKNVSEKDITGECGDRKGRPARPGTMPAVPDVFKAVKRLEGFMFVGLMEHYPLSVCLFHMMFGGQCLQMEFRDMRPVVDGPQNMEKVNSSSYDVGRLNGFKDPYDGELYVRAEAIFWRQVEEHNVTAELCHKLCPHRSRQMWERWV